MTHLIEDGLDELFVRMQVGHRFASTTALYTGVSGDYKNEAMSRALRAQLGEELALMGEIDYEWMLRPLLAERGMHSYAELAPLLAEHGVRLSESQVWRLFTGKPERLNLHTLMVLCRILDCTPNDLIKPVEAPVEAARGAAAAAGRRRGDR